MINWVRVLELFEDFDEHSFAEVAEIFVCEVDESCERLVRATDADTMRAEFHFLKGATMTMGFDEVAKLCAEGEKRAEARQDCDIERAQVAAQLKATCELFLAEWRSRMAQHR